MEETFSCLNFLKADFSNADTREKLAIREIEVANFCSLCKEFTWVIMFCFKNWVILFSRYLVTYGCLIKIICDSIGISKYLKKRKNVGKQPENWCLHNYYESCTLRNDTLILF